MLLIMIFTDITLHRVIYNSKELGIDEDTLQRLLSTVKEFQKKRMQIYIKLAEIVAKYHKSLIEGEIEETLNIKNKIVELIDEYMKLVIDTNFIIRNTLKDKWNKIKDDYMKEKKEILSAIPNFMREFVLS